MKYKEAPLDTSEWEQDCPKNIPQQHNDRDCGE